MARRNTTTQGATARRTAKTRPSRASLEKKGLKYCFSSYVDVHGIAKGKAVPIDHFGRMMRGSELFTGAALDGLGQGPHDDELAVHPDPDAIVQLPWWPEVAWARGCLKWTGSR